MQMIMILILNSIFKNLYLFKTYFSENITQLNANYCENLACIDNKVIT